MGRFEDKVKESTGTSELSINSLYTFQVNIGLRCDLACEHCHVASSPRRKEAMTYECMQQVLAAAKEANAKVLDITGGAPELHEHFRDFVEKAVKQGLSVIVRTNLTVFHQEGLSDMPDFYQGLGVRLVASLPCYLEENVDKQRGDGTFVKSIESLKALNAVGYGKDESLQLDLVYNPIGATLPPEAKSLEQGYRDFLKKEFDICFSQLITITNMPIGRFWGNLKKDGLHTDYLDVLSGAYNSGTLEHLMCRNQLSIRWDGEFFDCDFNLALKMPLESGGNIENFSIEKLLARKVKTAQHCFGCTAGAGSSCGGTLVS